MNIEAIRDNFKTFGLAAGLHDVTKKTMNRVVPVRMLCTMKLTAAGVDAKFLTLPAGLEGRFLDEQEVLRWAEDPRLDLEVDFVRNSWRDGDRCYGILDGQTLASYGWYSKRPTMMTEDLRFHFDSDYVYMFKGFTLPAYRGKRLHAIGMANALRAYTELGSKGILSYVESNNFASLRSCRRMGYEDIGTIVVSKIRGRHYSFASPACRRYALRVDAISEPAQIAQA
jgi:hypothetical protein